MKNNESRDAALALLKEEEQICRELKDWHALKSNLGKQVYLLEKQKAYVEALAILDELETGSRENRDLAALVSVLRLQGKMLRELQELPKALDRYEKLARLGREMGNHELQAEALFDQALTLSLGDETHEAAQKLADEAHSLAMQHGYSEMCEQMAPLRSFLRFLKK